jgi:ligand-binding sensor domain-containing protein
MRQPPKTLLGPVFAIVLLGSFLCAGRTAAQTLPLTLYTTANGLAHDSVNRIIRDSRGFMWFGTGEGLSRFDGYEFKNYTQADGLPNRSVNDILELPDRGIFLLATSNGVVVFDPKGVSERQASGNSTPMFRTFRPAQLSEAKGAAIINCLLRTRDGHVWIGTGDGLYDTTVNGAELSFRRVDRRNWLNAPALPSFSSVLQDRTGKFWLSVPLGTVFYDPATDQPTLVRKQPEGGSVLFEDRNGYVWSGGGNTDDTGLARFTLLHGAIDPSQTVTFTPRDGLGLNGWFNGLLETKDGRFFVGQPSGVTQYQPDALPGQPKFRTVVSDADVLCLGEDIDGNLWIGTDTRGVMKLSRKGFEVFGQKEGLPDAQVSSVIPGTGAEIFTSSGYFELARFDGTKFSSVRPQGMRGRSWGWNQIDVHSKIDGDWWIATKTGVLRYAAPARFEQLGQTPPKRVYDLHDGFRTPEVFRMWEDSRGNIWIYPFNSLNDNITYLFQWERSTDRVRRFSSDEGVPWGTNTSAFGEDRAGNIWIGAYNGGITRYRNGQFHYYSPDTGFPAGFVNAFLLDRQGRLWVATGTTVLAEYNLGLFYIGTCKGITRL